MQERKKTVIFFPWISIQFILFAIASIFVIVAFMTMLGLKLFGPIFNTVAEWYVNYLAAIPFLIFSADQIATSLIKLESTDPNIVPTSKDIQNFYDSFITTPVLTREEVVSTIIFVSFVLLFILIFYYRKGIQKGTWRWVGRSLLLLLLIGIPLSGLLSTYIFSRKVDFLDFRNQPYIHIYKAIQQYLLYHLIALPIVSLFVIFVGNGLIYLIGRKKKERDQRRIERKLRKLQRLNEKRNRVKEYY